MRYRISFNTISTSVSGRSLIDQVIEPLLKTSGVVNTLLHISASDPLTAGVVSAPRRRFIEDNRANRYRDQSTMTNINQLGVVDGSLKEKTAMQGLIDRHWYGEPLERVLDSTNTLLGVIPNPTLFPEDDSRIYDATLPRTIDRVNRFPPGDIGSGLQPTAEREYFGLRYNRLLRTIGNGTINTAPTAVTTTGAWGDTSKPYWLAGEVWTIEIQADTSTFAVRSNLRGSFPSGTIGQPYSIQPAGFSTSAPMFTITQGSTAFAAGDAFILDTAGTGRLEVRVGLGVGPFPTFTSGANLNGWWEVMPAEAMPNYSSGMKGNQFFTTSTAPAVLGSTAASKEDSWVIFVRKIRNSSGVVIGFEVHHREVKLAVESPTTKFWFNSVDQLVDSETKKRVFDNIKLLASNISSIETGQVPLRRNQTYDVVGSIADDDGQVDFNQLEVVPSDLLQEDESGNLIPDRLLQFETFAAGSYEYFQLSNPTVMTGNDPVVGGWEPGSTVSNDGIWGRNLRMPDLRGNVDGLDFMWQHFSPFTNIIDPSVTNIHDAYLMTRGYYDNVISYVRGLSTSAPTPPTPLELRNSYGYLLDNKMLSDTVVLHPGKLRLLFGALAEPQLRAKFKVVRAQSASLTNERIKEEILSVINTFFDIDNWDFGDTFYATELISLIHRRLPTDVASVVLVPLYSTNSFGSLFTVESGIDEILQSAAELSDIEVVEALTPSIIRQQR